MTQPDTSPPATQSQNIRTITEDADFGITLSDGTRLSARFWRPEDGEDAPVPMILEFLPYRKRDGTADRDELTHPWFAERGYACLRVDMRGNGESDGFMEDEYTAQELSDAVEVINWAAAQPWCNGNVGMMGISWGGFNSLQVAGLAPEPLKAIITLCSTADRFADDIHYKGGALLNENLGWGATMWCFSSRPPDPALRADWREVWLDRLECEPFLAPVWLGHQSRDDYWKHGSVCEDYSSIKAAVLAVGGWADSYRNTVPELVENIPSPVKGIMGTWAHKYPHFATPEPRIGFLQEALRWWDHWLKGKDQGVAKDPDYRAFVMDGVRPQTFYPERKGRWVAEEHGASSHLPRERLHLTDQGLTETEGALGASIRSPHTCGAASGEYYAIAPNAPEQPGDQRADDALSLCFDGAPLEQDIDILGDPRITLHLSSDHAHGQVAVRLNHIHPDGASTRITYGVLNLAHRDSAENPTPLPVGEDIEVSFTLDHCGYRVPAGHRLRVAVSTAYWPMIWPAPSATELTLSAAHLDLPVRKTATGDEVAFPPPQSAPPRQVETLRAPDPRRTVTTDMATGETCTHVYDDYGKVRDLAQGLVSGMCAREWWTIRPDDPLSAHGRCHWTAEVERDETRLRTETFSEMTSNAQDFLLTGRLEAYENDILVFSRNVSERIPRHHL